MCWHALQKALNIACLCLGMLHKDSMSIEAGLQLPQVGAGKDAVRMDV